MPLNIQNYFDYIVNKFLFTEWYNFIYILGKNVFSQRKSRILRIAFSSQMIQLAFIHP
jgi:hypothetical protein